MLLQLGNFSFSLNALAFQELSLSTGFRWEPQQPIGQAPLQQFLGPDSKTLALKGLTFPPQLGKDVTLQQLKKQAEIGNPLLMTQQGKNLGKWCIKKINETRSIFDTHGNPLKLEFDIELVQYGH